MASLHFLPMSSVITLLFLFFSNNFDGGIVSASGDEQQMDTSNWDAEIDNIGRKAVKQENLTIWVHYSFLNHEEVPADRILVYDRVVLAKRWVRKNGAIKYFLVIYASMNGKRAGIRRRKYYVNVVVDVDSSFHLQSFDPPPWEV